eukprot:CAMPEP_0178763266 /NCGR_PEP_ID=MMETSP0744-20121128/17049_1 /TAXON_ID=913974 /ORGANISM="Nitzschia punctata, Strain CCMP561" /LENGTH=300 /DNA_ID=CAMNT_0020418129 /DNA_START=24 /DNA_END=923 /DNA_ORIENTATION=+
MTKPSSRVFLLYVAMLIAACDIYARLSALSSCSVQAISGTFQQHHNDNGPMTMMEDDSDDKDSGMVVRPTTYTMLVVRCRANLTWISDLPSDWRVVVYEKCGQTTIGNENITVFHNKAMTNVAPEECSSYVDYVYDFYHDLTDVTVFMQDDWMATVEKFKVINSPHTTFTNISELAAVTKHLMEEPKDGRIPHFLHYGKQEYVEGFGRDPYHGVAEQALWPLIASARLEANSTTTSTKPPEVITFRPGATFAVRKDRILANPRETYHAIKSHILIDGSSSTSQEKMYEHRRSCCAMERMW